MLESASPAHATELAATAAKRHEAVVAFGGDGMVHLVANGVIGGDAAFGIIPSGSGNDFAAHLGYPRHSPVAACDVVAGGVSRPVDAGRIAGGPAFLCVAGAGFDSEVNRAANQIRWARGTAVYVAATLTTLARFHPARFKIVLDGSTESFDGMFVAVANAASYGGGMRIAPSADVTDGLFDVCIVRGMKRRTLLAQLPRIFSGNHVSHPAVEIRRAREVSLSADRPFFLYADGEEIGPLPYRLLIEPKALRVIAAG